MRRRWPEGWYTEDGLLEPGQRLRWWDGCAWTEYVWGPPVEREPFDAVATRPPFSLAAALAVVSALAAWTLLVLGAVSVRHSKLATDWDSFFAWSAAFGLASITLSLAGIGATRREGQGPGAHGRRRGRWCAIVGLVLAAAPPGAMLILAGGAGNT